MVAELWGMIVHIPTVLAQVKYEARSSEDTTTASEVAHVLLVHQAPV